jgi:dCTP deaminase
MTPREPAAGFGWLTGKMIHQEVSDGHITVEPYSSERLNPNSYNYRLAPQLKLLTSTVIDCKKDDEYLNVTIPDEGYILHPGECYLGATLEVFGSNHYASLITGRSSIGRKFVTNHVTAGLIDQGFFGNITLEILVHKPTRVYPGMKFGQIFWFTTFGEPLLYDGKYQGQTGPTPSRLVRDFGNSFSETGRLGTEKLADRGAVRDENALSYMPIARLCSYRRPDVPGAERDRTRRTHVVGVPLCAIERLEIRGCSFQWSGWGAITSVAD